MDDDEGGDRVIGRVRRKWRGRSTLVWIDTYSRWMLQGQPWLSLAFTSLMLVVPDHLTAPQLAVVRTILALCALQAVVFVPLGRRALDRYMGKGPAPWGLIAVSMVLTIAVFGALTALSLLVGPADSADASTLGMLVGGTMVTALIPSGAALSLLIRKRVFLGGCGLSAAALLLVGGALSGAWPLWASVAALEITVGLMASSTGRSVGWFLAVMWKLEAARGVQARLAVAEERLRFGRDMHDVLGRNLAVISLKSELAVQLARRGRDEAVDQMVEVQRIAQESQREVREVVRGYREADLQVELAGARSVLQAAGVGCQIEGDGGAGLPADVQSALGWVAREGTTNVLRHAPDAGRCVIRTRVSAGRAVLVMENDGVRETAPGPDGSGGGSGLKGLRERLLPLGGTLQAERRPDGSYRLTAQLPVPAAAGVQEGGAI
ncbi:sensor histidine kinase [Streptomyces sp. NPDC048595]|uniref:sensor histidine kinase n=1 Tax=Streptomyces sp. NPDC048595 TaxID=3365576 RepID=UPI00371A382E